MSILGDRRNYTEEFLSLLECKDTTIGKLRHLQARALDEEDKLIEAGLEFVRCDQNSQTAVYRKRR